MPSAQRLLLSCAACLVLAVAGCGGDSSSSTSSTSAVTGWLEGEVGSRVSVPEGPPPKELVIKDLAKGTGPPAKRGDEVEFEYVDALYSTGEVQSVAVPGAPYHLELGSHGSVPGWEKGIVGMRVGGRRELIIPPDLGDGEALVLQATLVGIK